MGEIFQIELEEFDLGQVVDGLQARADAWEKTANYHRTGEAPPDFIVEECLDYEEAEQIASRYRWLISNIQTQRRAQS